MDSNKIVKHNQEAWNKKVENNDRWTTPVSKDEITAAREGKWQVFLTNSKPVPKSWFPDLKGLEILCLASAGGQQAPILAAAGAVVTSFDNSPNQLAQDKIVSERDGLNIRTIQGSMDDLNVFPNNVFDLIFNPISNIFIPDLAPMWRETFRVRKPRGTMLAGFVNPVIFIFDHDLEEKGVYQVRYSLPYSDLTSITRDERLKFYGVDAPIEFSHTLQDQIGGQIEAGFEIIGFYEDYVDDEKIREYMPSFFSTRARKPVRN
jgi:SAM-dependent methyltransferase